MAHVALSFDVGGAERLLVDLARHVDRDRFEFSFTALTSDGVIGRELRQSGASVEALEGADGLRPQLAWKLAGRLRRQRVHIVHTHLDRPHIYGTLAARLSGVRRLVHTRHGQSVDLTPRQRRLIRWTTGFTDRFVCVSNDVARISCEEHGIARDRIRTIRNGVDLARFPRAPTEWGGPIVTVARLVPEKDLETLIRAASIAIESDPSLRFELAGDGPCRGALEELARSLGISRQFVFLGAVDNVASLLGRAGMFVLSSRTEGISLALLEAQAQGVPVVATRVGGNQEVIQDDTHGVLVPPQDPAALAEGLLSLRRDRRRAARLVTAARRRVEDDFDVTKMVHRYQSLYESLMTSGRLVSS